ncbi:MAG TPA: DHH family phosphoesterase [Candidatus Saccharimonadales bacterium]|nr:DHH family phosphoesterase [Candidatus Saccharimonadales bacterium]
MYEQAEEIQKIITDAERIVVLQADNPDGDSLASSLALEQILGDMGKDAIMYCAVDMPSYLHYLNGWDRVQKDIPKQFDASIVVDASTMTLFEKLSQSGQQGWLSAKKCIVLDHHESVDKPLPFASVTINDHERASTGDLVYKLAGQLGWPLNQHAKEFIMTSILGDTQGLTNQLASADTYRVMAELVDGGVDRPMLEELRREYSKMPPEIFKYKAELIDRTAFSAEGAVAAVSIPQTEINKFSPLYNPAPLIQNDMLQTTGVRIAIVFKEYGDGHLTAAIRCNPGAGIGAKLAEHFGGGGHPFASGFKVSGKPFDQVKSECITKATELINTL